MATFNETPTSWTPEAIARAFEGRIQPVRTTLGYKLGLLLSSFVMVLLPVAYLALIALVAWLTFLWAQNYGWVTSVRGRGIIMAGALWLTPIFAGITVVVFMLRPFFAAKAPSAEPQPLERKQAPLLFALVDQIAGAVGSPRPNRILVDGDVNASASFPSFFGMLRRDLTLTVGLPLLAGMEMRQLTGVVAHELGHFGQGMGMGLTYVVRSMSGWFAGLVYRRDAFDETLSRWQDEADHYLAQVLVGFARCSVWLTRKVLWLFLTVGASVSAYLMRQMEFDADRYEARVAGSSAYRKTALRLKLLSAARGQAFDRLNETWAEGRLVDDLHGLTARLADDFPKPVVDRVRRAMLEERTGFFDTHPCDRERIASAEREAAKGILRVDAPAAVLVPNLSELCREDTKWSYELELGKAPRADQLVSPDDYLGEKKADDEAQAALGRFAFDAVSGTRMPRPRFDVASTDDPSRTLAALRAARERAREQSELGRSVLEKEGEARALLAKAQVATSLNRSGLSQVARAASLPTDADAARSLKAQAEQRRESNTERLAELDELFAQRLAHAFSLLHHPRVAERVPQAADRLEWGRRIAPALTRLAASAERVERVEHGQTALGAVLSNHEATQSEERLMHEVRSIASGLCDELSALRNDLADTPYPFAHADGSVSLGEHVVPAFPSADDLGALHGLAGAALERFTSVQVKALSQAAVTAEAVERACGVDRADRPAAQGSGEVSAAS